MSAVRLLHAIYRTQACCLSAQCEQLLYHTSHAYQQYSLMHYLLFAIACSHSGKELLLTVHSHQALAQCHYNKPGPYLPVCILVYSDVSHATSAQGSLPGAGIDGLHVASASKSASIGLLAHACDSSQSSLPRLPEPMHITLAVLKSYKSICLHCRGSVFKTKPPHPW